MSDDIVARLRVLTKTLLLGDFKGLAETTESAADEIERLRDEASELRGWKVDALKTYQVCAMERDRLRVIVQGWEHSARNSERDIETLRAERDEARRRVCENAIQHGRVYRRVGRDTVRCETVKEVAEIMGWDCFKEDSDDR